MKLRKIIAGLTSGLMALSSLFFGEGLAYANDSKDVYVLMNIPYDEFYEAEISSDTQVDAVTSATLAKTRSGSLAGGSYHVDDSGKSIDGVTFYVKTTEDDLKKLEGAKVITDDSRVSITVTMKGKEQTSDYEGKEALFEAPDYSYYVLSETPAYYKELTIENGKVSFSEVKGTYSTIKELKAGTDISYTFTDNSKYGDYELDFDTDEGAAVLSSYIDSSTDTIYGVIVETENGSRYGLRHVENIWRTSKLAWSVGVVTEAHGSPLSYTHYKSMVGQTITKVTYLTSKGKIVINGLSEKVNEKSETAESSEEKKPQESGSDKTEQTTIADKTQEATTDKTQETTAAENAAAGSAQEQTSSDGTSQESPKTGDNVQIVLSMALLMAAALSFAAASKAKKVR